MMRTNNSFINKILLLLILLVPGCGGSTTGTGGITVEGKILSPTGNPIQNVQVTVLSTGDITTTDSTGSFVITTTTPTQTELLFETQRSSSTVSINNIPTDAEVVSASFVLNEDNGTVEEPDISVKKRKNSNNNGGQGGSSSSKDDDDDNDDKGPKGNNGDESKDDSDDGPDSNGNSSSSGSPEETRFDNEGVLESIGDGTVIVDRLTYLVNEDTRIKDKDNEVALSDLTAGVLVRVRGTYDGQSYHAERIEVKE